MASKLPVPVHLIRTITGEADTPQTVRILHSHSDVTSPTTREARGFALVSLLLSDLIPTCDEDDIFQCGGCKTQFSSFQTFVEHKRTRNECAAYSQREIISSKGSSNTQLVYQGADKISKLQDLLPKKELSESTASSSSLLQGEHIRFKIPIEHQRSLPQHFSTFPVPVITVTETEFSNLLSAIGGNCQLTSYMSDTAISTEQNTLTATVISAPESRLSNEKETHHCVSDNNQSRPKMGYDDFLNKTPPILCCSQHPLALPSRDSNPSIVVDLQSCTPLSELDKSYEIPKRSPMKQSSSCSSLIKSSNSNFSSPQKINTIKKCEYCGKTFKKLFNLHQHVRSHTGDKPFSCLVCRRGFTQKSNVKKHMKTHMIWPKIKSTFPDSILSKLKNRDCTSCDMTPDRSRTNNNVDMKMISNLYACQYCDDSFYNYHKLKTHMQVHQKEKVFKCNHSDCNAVFSKVGDLIGHVESDHENVLEYQCRQYCKEFKNAHVLEAHEKSHPLSPSKVTVSPKPSERKFLCTKCNNRYASEETLSQHLFTSSHDYPCPLCHLKFVCERYLRRHLKIHEPVEPYKCVHCGKLFKTDNYLKSHLVVHSEDKPFKCEACGSLFNRRDKLSRHQLIHENRKIIECSFKNCTRVFYRKGIGVLGTILSVTLF